ncbi:hypothetical protein [Paracoccus contaminans]|uniref:hypothetical protein n=1 Tax=Paracoccus contaminans TaxID=1945662 RepID=UPI0012F4810E|nr:hypothetical protein [Paracoccus contaminans]
MKQLETGALDRVRWTSAPWTSARRMGTATVAPGRGAAAPDRGHKTRDTGAPDAGARDAGARQPEAAEAMPLSEV